MEYLHNHPLILGSRSMNTNLVYIDLQISHNYFLLYWYGSKERSRETWCTIQSNNLYPNTHTSFSASEWQSFLIQFMVKRVKYIVLKRDSFRWEWNQNNKIQFQKESLHYYFKSWLHFMFQDINIFPSCIF